MSTNIIWQQLNSADYVIIGIIGLSALISIVRGFVREALSLATWVIAAWIAIRFSTPTADLFIGYIKSQPVRTIAAFASLFLITLLIGAMINFLFTQLIDRTGLSSTDRLLGLLFGVARGILLVGVLVMLGTVTNMQQESWWKKSQLVPQFQPLSAWLASFLPNDMNNFSKSTK